MLPAGRGPAGTKAEGSAAMTAVPASERPKVSLLYNPRVRTIAYQTLLCAVIAFLAWSAINNAIENLRVEAARKQVGWAPGQRHAGRFQRHLVSFPTQPLDLHCREKRSGRTLDAEPALAARDGARKERVECALRRQPIDATRDKDDRRDGEEQERAQPAPRTCCRDPRFTLLWRRNQNVSPTEKWMRTCLVA